MSKEREATLPLGQSSSHVSYSNHGFVPSGATAAPPAGGAAAPSQGSANNVMTPPRGQGLCPGQGQPMAGAGSCGVGECSYWKSTAMDPSRPFQCGVNAGTATHPPPQAKSVLEAYILCLVFGVVGAHHFYLGRPCFGILYFFSFGLCGLGWLIDMFRMPCLVARVNKENVEKHQQLLLLQEQLAQQRQLQQQAGHVITPLNVLFVPFEPRSLADAYILWFPMGLFGFHHFYLRNYGMGFLYFFTFGLLGIGWIVDAFRLPGLVREANCNSPLDNQKVYSQCTAHILALSPAGLVGGHHYYLDRPVWGLLYTLTLGLCGTGWVWDWFRTSCLVRRANDRRQGRVQPDRKYVDEAYVLCFPWGFTGLHHFYLGRYGWGALYFFTFGILGIGWLVDLCRLPCLVKEANARLEESSRRLLTTNTTTPASSFTSITVTGGGAPTSTSLPGPGTYYGGPQPVVWNSAQLPAGFYTPSAGYGYQAYPVMYQGAPGPYPTIMTPGGGPAGVYPPQYSTATTGNAGTDVPPSYEASLAPETKNAAA